MHRPTPASASAKGEQASERGGYAHPAYARSLADFGEPVELPRSGGSLLRRPVPESGRFDATGCYPLFACREWAALSADLDELGGLVAVSLVADPFGKYDTELLARTFPDLCRPFKEHYVVDLDSGYERSVSRHHRQSLRRALRKVTAERVADPRAHLDEWCELYGALVARHGIRGMAAFSREAFERQLDVPGLSVYRAKDYAGEGVGMALWLQDGDVAYHHLGAYGGRGYKLESSYPIMACALEDLAARGVRHAHLGGRAGTEGERSGLDFFKEGWAGGTRTAFLCGRILDRAAYDDLARRRGVEGGGWFPLYRSGETL